jgi:hypothetical protein
MRAWGDPSHHIDRAKGEIEVNVKSCGAKGDGTTDDTFAVRAALAYVNAKGGGILRFPAGTYNLATATLAGLTDSAMSITADGVEIRGAGAGDTILQLTGSTTGARIFYSAGVSDVTYRDLTFKGVGNAAASNAAIGFYGVNTKDTTGLRIQDCEFHDFKALEWVDIEAVSGSYDIRGVHVERCRFQSYDGNRYSDADGIRSSFLHLDTGGPGGYVRDVWIRDCWMDGQYMRTCIGLKDGVQYAHVTGCILLNAGSDLATDNRECYGLMLGYGSGCQYLWSEGNYIYNPYQAGIYSVGGSHVTIAHTTVIGQSTTWDTTLVTGAIACGAIENLKIIDCEVGDSEIGIEVQPADLEADIEIIGCTVRNCGTKGLLIRETATWMNAGGVTIAQCHVHDSDVVVYRSTGSNRLHHVTIADNTVVRGKIHVQTDCHGLLVSGNKVWCNRDGATQRGIYFGGTTIATVVGNRVWGPGSDVASSYGLYFNTFLLGLSIVKDNQVNGFFFGMYAPYALALSRDNLFTDVDTEVESAVAGDMGRDAPGTIVNTVTNYARAGTFVQDHYPSGGAARLGWVCTAPAHGLGSSYAAATFTGDMTNGEYVISDVSDHDRFIPGVQLTLANAAAGPALLTTEVVAWEVTYTGLSGTFEEGEFVEDTTGGLLATVSVDNGSDTCELVNIAYDMGTLAVGNTIKGHKSGATATVSAIKLKVADACGNTVNDETLSLQTLTWTAQTL